MLVLIASRGVELSRRNLLQRRGMDNDVNAFHYPEYPLAVADVTDKHPQVGIISHREPLPHLELLQFVTAKDDDPCGLMIMQQPVDERVSERFPVRLALRTDLFPTDMRTDPLLPVILQLRRSFEI